jgi:hypothetical protein
MTSPKVSGEVSPKDMLDHAWQYFALHAGQRMSLFNFFLVLAGLVAAGLAACAERSGPLLLLGAALGLLLTLVSFIFWKLDQRVSFFLKHAEEALANIELFMPITAARLVSNERERTASVCGTGFFLFRMWTYGSAFRTVFAVMATVGATGGMLCVLRYLKG